MLEIECIWECDDGLGETPIWVAEEASVYWADHVGPAIDLAGSRRPSIHRLNVETGHRTTWPMPEQVGSFGLRPGEGWFAAPIPVSAPSISEPVNSIKSSIRSRISRTTGSTTGRSAVADGFGAEV